MIPIFRAKHYRDDVYFIGSLIGKEDEYYIVQDEDMEYYRPIAPTTLAIHFPDMLDSQGNKIFASLSEDGKGGDIVESYHYTDTNNKEHKLKHIAKWSNKYKGILFVNENSRHIDETGNGTGNVQMWTMKESKVIGIQE